MARIRRLESVRDLGRAGDLGALAHYTDPAYYDKAYGARRHDVEYYVALARRLKVSSVLEYGVGNGRVALPLARAGVAVFGVDLSAPMLHDLERRLREEPPEVRARVTLRQADMRTLSLRRRFPLVIAPFNVILHLYERRDFERFFQRARAHLDAGGRLVFDWSAPHAEELCRDPLRAFGAPRIRYPGTGELMRYAERFEYDPLRQVLLTWMDFMPVSGEPGFTVPLTHRQVFPQEMLALLHYNGFSDVRLTADFANRKPDAAVDSLVAHCRPGAASESARSRRRAT